MKIKNKGGLSTKYGGISMVNMDNELIKKILYTFQGTVGTYEEQVILNDVLSFKKDGRTGLDILNGLCDLYNINYEDVEYDVNDIYVNLSDEDENVIKLKILSDLEVWYYKSRDFVLDLSYINEEKIKYLFRVLELKDGVYRFTNVYDMITKFRNRYIDNIFVKSIDPIELGNQIIYKLLNKRTNKNVTLYNIQEMLDVVFNYLQLSDYSLLNYLYHFSFVKDGIVSIDLLTSLIRNLSGKFNIDFIFYQLFLKWINTDNFCKYLDEYVFVDLEQIQIRYPKINKEKFIEYLVNNTDDLNIIEIDTNHYLITQHKKLHYDLIV